MPDLLTHALVGHAAQRASAGRLDLTLVLAGSMLPDVVAWLPMKVVPRLVGLGFPPEVQRLFPPMHAPLLVLAWCGLLALLFVAAQRRLAFASIAAGAMLHVVLDLVQAKLDGGYLLLYPLSLEQVQLGLVSQDDWLLVLALAAGCSAVAEVFWQRSGRGGR